jgi:hypothetical protein
LNFSVELEDFIASLPHVQREAARFIGDYQHIIYDPEHPDDFAIEPFLRHLPGNVIGDQRSSLIGNRPSSAQTIVSRIFVLHNIEYYRFVQPDSRLFMWSNRQNPNEYLHDPLNHWTTVEEREEVERALNMSQAFITLIDDRPRTLTRILNGRQTMNAAAKAKAKKLLNVIRSLIESTRRSFVHISNFLKSMLLE